MDKVAYARALRAAMQVSFVALTGCASEAPSTEMEAKGDSTEAVSDPVRTAPAKTNKPHARRCDAGAGVANAADAQADSAALTCKERLHAAFPNGDSAWWDTSIPSHKDDALKACCADALAKSTPNGSYEDYRASGCCHVDGVPEAWAACTPWGPPMPPSIASWLAGSFGEGLAA